MSSQMQWFNVELWLIASHKKKNTKHVTHFAFFLFYHFFQTIAIAVILFTMQTN